MAIRMPDRPAFGCSFGNGISTMLDRFIIKKILLTTLLCIKLSSLVTFPNIKWPVLLMSGYQIMAWYSETKWPTGPVIKWSTTLDHFIINKILFVTLLYIKRSTLWLFQMSNGRFYSGPHTNAFLRGLQFSNYWKRPKYFTSWETQYSCLRHKSSKQRGCCPKNILYTYLYFIFENIQFHNLF